MLKGMGPNCASTYEKGLSGGGERKKGGLVLKRIPLAAACAFESGHLNLLSGAGEGPGEVLRP